MILDKDILFPTFWSEIAIIIGVNVLIKLALGIQFFPV